MAVKVDLTPSPHPPPNSEFGIPNSEFRIPNSEFRIPNSEFRIPNSEGEGGQGVGVRSNLTLSR